VFWIIKRKTIAKKRKQKQNRKCKIIIEEHEEYEELIYI
jgi:hypothetical protein